MLRIALLFIVCCMPAISAAAPSGPKLVAGQSNDQESADLIKEAATQPRQGIVVPGEQPMLVNKSPDYERSCENAERTENSDLCAQWTAANASARVAEWTPYQTWLSFAQTILVIASVGLAFWSVRISHEGVRAARDGIGLAGLAVAEAQKTNEIAHDSLTVAADSLVEQQRATHLAIEEFIEARQPSAVVSAITLEDRWQDMFDGAGGMPLRIMVENIGGGTARHVGVELDRIEVLDRSGAVIASHSQRFLLAPLRPRRPRVEPMIVRRVGGKGRAHRILVRGSIQSKGDLDLAVRERFVWGSDPMNRGAGALVERHPDYDLEKDVKQWQPYLAS